MITEINVTLSPTICEEVIATLQYIKDHSKLDHLDYASSGHTGFASKTYVDTQIALVSTPIKKGNLETSLYQDCLVEGQETTQNVVSQWWASTFGRKNESGVNGFAAFTCGTRNSNDGDSAFVTGISNVLTGNAWASIIGGSHNTVNGAYESLTVGEFNVLTSDATYAGMFGHHNEADGSGGLTFGRYNYNYTTNGFCGGEHNRTNIHNRAVLGNYNDSSEENGTRLFVIGNGYTTQELPIGIALKPNNDTPLFTFSTPLLVSDSLIVDIKFTSGPAADDRTRFKLEDDSGHASSFIRVNSNGTLGDSYSGISISSLRADGYYRVTIQPGSFSPSLLNISKIQAAGNYSMATGYIRANPIPETVEHRQNAFEVYDDGSIFASFLTDGVTLKSISSILDSCNNANLKNGAGNYSIQQLDPSVTSFTNTYNVSTEFWELVYNNVGTITDVLTKDYANKKINILQTGSLGASSNQNNGKSLAYGKRSATRGSSTIALGEGSSSEGNATISIGSYSHAEGNQTLSVGNRSHAEGSACFSGGSNSHAEGNQTKTTADSSHSEGAQTVASGGASHAEGQSTIASALHSHAEGESTLASGSNSHAEGLSTIASGNNSHAEGQYTDTNGKYNAHCEGLATKASATSQTVIGTYNDYQHDSDALFVVGNGGSENSRSDAFKVIGDGTAIFNNLSDGITTVSVTDLLGLINRIANLEAIIEELQNNNR